MPETDRPNPNPARLAIGRSWTDEARRVRAALGLSQPQFAAKLGVTVWTIRNAEQGRRTYSLALRRRIAALGGDRAILRADEDHCPHCGHPSE